MIWEPSVRSVEPRPCIRHAKRLPHCSAARRTALASYADKLAKIEHLRRLAKKERQIPRQVPLSMAIKRHKVRMRDIRRAL